MEYEGTAYNGWQRQTKSEVTIQEKIEESILKTTGEKIAIHGSGRTDAGVHAIAQTANFLTGTEMDTETLCKALNSFLPEDISVSRVEEMPSGFHSRASLIKKTYIYKILNRPSPSALERKTCWFIPQPLDADAMRDACGFVVGEHDFAVFAHADSKVRTTVRTVFSATLKNSGDFLIFSIEANGFLKRMVRLIVGTLVRVGRGKLSAKGFEEIMKTGVKTVDVVSAPPQGLFLEKVEY